MVQRKFFFFRNDRRGYKIMTEHLLDFSKRLFQLLLLVLGLIKFFGSKNLKITKIKSPRIRSHFMDHYPIVLELLFDKIVV